MKCSETNEFLSSYFDDELPTNVRETIAAHLNECEPCRIELARFKRLSDIAQDLESPVPPDHVWTRLERDMRGQPSTVLKPSREEGSLRTARHGRLLVAASVVLAMGLGWFAYSNWFAHDKHASFTAAFGHYLQELRRNPTSAQEFLLSKYEGQQVEAENARHLVGYRPAVSSGMPDGYSLESTSVMTMPCCTCVQCVCRGRDGSTLVIFEHDDEEMTEWFGNRPATSKDCAGKRCRVVDLDGRLAASWRRDRRYITVVGIRDDQELTELVTWFDRQTPVRP